MNRPLFSCVMPVKGPRPYMDEALASLHNQGMGSDLEIIIQDADIEPDKGQSDAINRVAAERETTIGLCVKSNAGVVSEFKGTYYICRDSAWVEATELEYDTYGLVGKDGAVKSGVVNGDKHYVYENGAWRASSGEIEDNLGACVTSREGEKQTLNDNYYVCESKEWMIKEGIFNYGSLTDTRDTKTYKTIKIGNQTWMAENLNYNYNEGTAKSYCFDSYYYGYCDKYGRLYSWSAAMDSAGVFSTSGEGCGYGKTCSASGTIRGVCPEGWHLPSEAEWDTLFTNVGGKSSAGTMLKSTSDWDSGNGDDTYGFAVLPAGYRDYLGFLTKFGYMAFFWSSTADDGYSAYSKYFDYSDPSVLEYSYGKYYAFSVRCLRDSN